MSSTIISLRRLGKRADELLSHMDERLAEEYGDAYLGVRTGAGPQFANVRLRPGINREAAQRRVGAFFSEISPEWQDHVALE